MKKIPKGGRGSGGLTIVLGREWEMETTETCYTGNFFIFWVIYMEYSTYIIVLLKIIGFSGIPLNLNVPTPYTCRIVPAICVSITAEIDLSWYMIGMCGKWELKWAWTWPAFCVHVHTAHKLRLWRNQYIYTRVLVSDRKILKYRWKLQKGHWTPLCV